MIKYIHAIKTLKKLLRYLTLSALVFTLILGKVTLGTKIAEASVATVSDTFVQSDPQQLLLAGKKYYQAARYSEAIAVWQQAQKQLLDRGDRLNVAVVLSNLALAYQQLGKFTEGNQAIAQSLDILSTGKSKEAQNLLAQGLNIQGSLHLDAGKAELALSSWQQAAKIYEKIPDRQGVIVSLINQAQAFKALGLYPRAKATSEQVSQLLQNQPDSLLKASSLLNLGDTLRVIGQLEKSQSALQQSLAIAKKLNSNKDIVLALLSLGNTTYSLSQTEEAINYYQQAISTSELTTTKLQAQLNLLRLFVETEQFSEAQTLASQIEPELEQLPSSRTSVYSRIQYVNNLSKLPDQKISREKAGRILAVAIQQAQSIEDDRAQSYSLGALGEQYEKTQQWKEAKQITEKALILAQASNADDIAYRWQWQLGRILQATGDSEQAINTYAEAVKSLSHIRNNLAASNIDLQFSFRESVEPVYRELVGLLLQPNNKEIPQENLKKARQTIESLQLAELDNYFREACLSAIPSQIDKIDPQAAVIYPIVLSDRLEVILSLPNQPLHHYTTTISEQSLKDILVAMRRSLRRTSLEKERLAIAKQVYDLLIRPGESELQANNIKTLAFVLDGLMKNLPMAALYDGEKYLVEKYNLALTPGLQLLAPQRLKRQKMKILVGGLSESRQGFSELPGVESEVQQIKSKIPAQVFFNQAFTSKAIEKQISTSSFPIVHLATHGQFSSNADDTFVLTWDNRLSVKQLGELLKNRDQGSSTTVELLVLSACQTADGDERAALGLAGVAVRSGARSTVATLWSVEDQSTSEFMVELYQQLGKSDVSKALALRNSQLALMKNPQFKHPFYWAPFVLVGNWL